MNPSAAVAPSTETHSAVDQLQDVLSQIANVHVNIDRAEMIRETVNQREALVSACGALATWNPADCTGRIPKDTYMVQDAVTQQTIDWNSSACIPMSADTFDQLWIDAVSALSEKEHVYVTDRCIGAAADHSLPVRTITNSPLKTLFVDNMFRAVTEELKESIFADEPFTMIVLPYDALDTEKYRGSLREVDGEVVDMVITANFERRLGIVYGTSYCGAVKKMVFTALNYYLPQKGILPLHCSANESEDGNVTLFLGLSGTGKTTVSNVPDRKLIGDDEHSWSNEGISNMENGCYAKLINLDPEKEPEIARAVFMKRPYLEDGVIIENAMMYPNGRFDLSDKRIAENSRASYPISLLWNAKKDGIGSHPNTIIFLTADANGVLPPVAKLTSTQAIMWFLMGYTSKLAGTETGITEPKSAFSRFFGGPFMPCKPREYGSLLGRKLQQHDCDVYLVNTGWTGGPYGTGERIDINITRAMVDAALTGQLHDVEYTENTLFHIFVPQECPGVDATVLDPRNTWEDTAAYDAAAQKLAQEFSDFFDVEFGNSDLEEAVRKECPGK